MVKIAGSIAMVRFEIGQRAHFRWIYPTVLGSTIGGKI